MQHRTTNRIMNVLIIIPIVMLLLSTLCLCTGGQMVGYFLACGGVSLIPLGFDTRRTAKFICLGIAAISMAAAKADHDAGVKYWKRINSSASGLYFQRSEGSPGDC